MKRFGPARYRIGASKATTGLHPVDRTKYQIVNPATKAKDKMTIASRVIPMIPRRTRRAMMANPDGWADSLPRFAGFHFERWIANPSGVGAA